MKKKIVSAFVLAMMLFSSTVSGVEAASNYVWKFQNNNWYYLNSSGKAVTGWALDNSKWYYLGSNGVMKTGWLLDRGTWYYLDKASGAMKTGWVLDGNKWYYLTTTSGAMKTGWLKDGNLWYYLDPQSGAMKTGWVYTGNSWYYLENSGAMKEGWFEENNRKYYLNPGSGIMATGQKWIDGKPYVFASTGALSTEAIKGWFRDGQTILYFNADGSLHTGWLIEGTKRYYFGADGFIYKGWLEDGGKKYYFDAYGNMKTGWLLDNNKWYYFNSDGTMGTGWILYNNKWYFLNSDGIMAIGWVYDNGDWYYLNNGGDMFTGWLWWDNSWYFLAANGKMVTGEQLIGGKTYYFFKNGVWNPGPVINYTNYNLTLQQMVDTQMKVNPQTDKYRNNNAYVSKNYILLDGKNPAIGYVTTNGLNVREAPIASAFVYGSLNQYYVDGNGQQQPQSVQIVSMQGDWYEIKYVTWRNPKSEDVAYYVNPNNFSRTSQEYFQFLLLSKGAGTIAQELNDKVLRGKGILEGKADAFIKAGKLNNINEIYLISHSLLETGNGKSPLAQGYKINGRTVYNMYGVGAFDKCPETCGAQYAYDQSWFTPEDAIIGGAAYIGKNYINDPDRKQDTLYKMRWNPAKPGTHQYATDIGWAAKQVVNMKKIYDLLDSYILYYDIPVYK